MGINYGYSILELSSGYSRWLDRKEESFTFVQIQMVGVF